MDPTCGLADKFWDLMFEQIWEQFLYLGCYGQYIERLTEQLVELSLERESLQHRIDAARNNAERIEGTVVHWLEEVDKIFKEVEQLQKESQAKRGCSITSCSNPWLRYKLSKSTKEMVQKVSAICEKGKFDTVSYPVPPQPQLELIDGESNGGIDSRVLIMNQIMEALQSQSINMIGLCGPGGVGKTTITKEVAKNQNKFETVIMATVSDELSIERIQSQIAEKLGMQLNEKDIEVRAHRLRGRLKQEKNMLVILDDLWEELDLGKAGISFVEGCKILVTSRNKTLLSKGMQCQKIIDVGVLSEDEALALFKRIANFSIDSSNPDLISTATGIVQSCGGLPLAIATAAKAFDEKDPNGCKDYLARLKNHLRRNFTGIKEVDASLKSSYSPLSRENKSIFLLTAMLSHDPSIEDLLMYSMGLDFLDGIENMEMEEAYFGISTAVSKLKSLNLLLDGSSSHHVTIHDVFRGVALSIAHNELPAFIVRHGTLRKWPDENKLESFKGICLQQSDIGDFPEELYSPRLEFFLLNSTKHDFSIPNMFFKSSKELKVLAFTNMHFPLLPSLRFLEKLKALCLHSCVLVDITEVGCLRELKVLSLANSEIERLPVQLAELTSLLILNLSHCSNLKVIPQGLLSSLKKLEVLYMGNSFHQWKVEGCSEVNENAGLDELMDLPISSLDTHIPNVSMLPEKLFFKMNLKRYKIFIGEDWEWQDNYETSKILKLQLQNSIHLKGGFQNLLEGVEDLYLSGSTAYENVFHNHDVREFPQLRYLQIDDNDEDDNYEDATKNVSNKTFKSIFNKKVSLPMLEMLELSNLLNMLIPLIWDDRLSHNSFNNLKVLTVERCGFVKLVPLHVLKSLNNLEEVKVRDCDMLEIVFDFEDLKDDKEMESSSMVVPLKKLKLEYLPKLKNVFSNNCQGNRHAVSAEICIKDGATNNTSNEISKLLFNKVLFPKLEILELSNLNSSTALIWDDQFSHNSVSNLKRLRVTSCGFVKLVPFHVLRYLKNLEELEVWDCNMLEIVFDFEDFKDDKEMESLSVVVPLKKLKLLDVRKLKNMFSNNCQGNQHVVTADLCIKDGATNNASNEISKSLFNKVLFPKLEILELSNLNSSIVLIWDDQLSHDSFSNLKRLWVDRCGFVKLVPLHVLKSLNNLEELEIYNCDMLEIVFDFEDFKYDKEMESSSMVVPLKKLKLHDLPKLKNVFSNNCQGNRHVVTADLCIKDGATNNASKEISKSLFNKVLFPKLEILELYDLNRLIALIRDDQLSNYSFSNLKTLMVKRCSFVKLVPFHMLKSLNNLEELEVEDCDMLEKVFDFEDLNDYKEMESSSVVVQLKKLKLSNLPKLKNVWGDHYQGNICFPSLRSIYVSDCESLTSIFPASIAKGMLCDLEELQIHQCAVDVIVAKDPVSESGAVTFEFLRLTSLMLSDLPNLRNFYPQKHTLEWPDLNQISIHFCDELEIFGKEVSCSSEIYEEENILDSKYPLLSHDKVISNLERLTLQGKEVEKIGNGQFLMYHFPELKLLHLSLEKKPFPCQKFWERSPNLGELKLSGDFGGDDVAALAARFPKLTLEKISIMGSLSPSLVSSPNVTHLNVNLCLEWTSLMTSSIARSLVHLTRLSVGHCSEMEEIITKQEGEDDENEEIIFIKLKLLELDNLPRLKRFCRHNYTFKFPLLDKIVITTCLEFKRFSSGLTDTPSLRSVQLSQDHWGQWHDEIWDTNLDTNLNKTFYQQRFVASTKVVLDEDDAIMMRNDQFPVDSYRQVEILRIEGFVDEWVTIPYTLLERFPKLNALHVKNSSFEQIFPSHAPFSTSFHNLTLLEVSDCHHLVYLVACSAVKSLVNLETLEIRNCEKLEEIVRNETNEDVERGITFNGLRILKLTRLPKLKTQEDKKDFNIADGTTNTRCTNISRALFSYNKVLLPKLEKLELSYLLNNLLSLKWDDSFSNLKTLFVYHCDFMKLVPLRVLKSLNNLEKLEVSNCGKLEMVFGFEDFNDYRKEMESSSVVVPLSLTHLVVHDCHGLISLMTSSVAACLVHITYLSISYCKQLEEIITKQEGEDDEDKEIFFNQMKFLDLKYLPKLKKFCGYNYTFRFPLLEHVTINECPRLTMFCQGAIHALQLQSVRVGNLGPHKDIWMTNLNNTIQHLFTFEEVISTTWSMALNEKNIRTIMAVFPEVRTLYVERFTDEGATFPYNSLERFPRLDWLYVEHCSFDEIFPPQDQIIDFMGKVSPFKDLGKLSVSGCHQLIHLVTTSTAKSLVSLRCLEIYNCKKMKEIVMNDTNDDVQGGIAFNRLYRIKLTDMPSLKMFSSQSHIFKFPKLQEIEISGCPEMKKFCPGVLKTPKLSKVKIEEHELEWKDEGDLNKTMEGQSSAKDSLNI